MQSHRYLSWLHDVTIEELPLIGRKATKLVEFVKSDIPTPQAFIVLPSTLHEVFTTNQLGQKIAHQLESIDPYNPSDVSIATRRIKSLIEQAEIPKKIALEIFDYYHSLKSPQGVSIRGSIGDTTHAPAHQSPYVGIIGDAALLQSIRQMWAQLLTYHNIKDSQINHTFDLSLSVIVESMIDCVSSGILFTGSPYDLHKDSMFINAAYGFKDAFRSDSSFPDMYQVKKIDCSLISQEISPQLSKIIIQSGRQISIEIPQNLQAKPKLTANQLVDLCKIGKRVQSIYFFPQKIEWVTDSSRVYVLDTQNLSTQDKVHFPSLSPASSTLELPVILSGTCLVPGMVTGPLKQYDNTHTKLSSGDIVHIYGSLQLKSLPLKKISGLIIEHVSPIDPQVLFIKSSGIPTILATSSPTITKSTNIVTLDAQNGLLYQGSPPVSQPNLNTTMVMNEAEKNQKTATKIFVESSHLENLSCEEADGIGLVKSDYFKTPIDKQNLQLSQIIQNILQESTGKPVLYRLPDIIQSENSSPLGMRGALMYLTNPHLLEIHLEAIFSITSTSDDVRLVIPFVRDPSELLFAKKIITSFNLKYNYHLPLYLAVETPSCALKLADYCEIGIDGVVIALNDLTMLTLGLDRNNPELQSTYPSSHPSVMHLVKDIISQSKKANLPVFLSGDAIENSFDILKYVIKQGVDGLCVSPAQLSRLRNLVSQLESDLISAS